ncbi:hypothetical protein P4634_02980 [Neobacillus mesonae]|nr:hypothetical protein [Neobacillus mesonae]
MEFEKGLKDRAKIGLGVPAGEQSALIYRTTAGRNLCLGKHHPKMDRARDSPSRDPRLLLHPIRIPYLHGVETRPSSKEYIVTIFSYGWFILFIIVFI